MVSIKVSMILAVSTSTRLQSRPSGDSRAGRWSALVVTPWFWRRIWAAIVPAVSVGLAWTRHKVFAEVPRFARCACSPLAISNQQQTRIFLRRRRFSPSRCSYHELLPAEPMGELDVENHRNRQATRLRQKGAVFSAGLLDERQTSVWLTNLKFRYQDRLARWFMRPPSETSSTRSSHIKTRISGMRRVLHSFIRALGLPLRIG